MEELFDTLEYAPDKRLKLAVLQLRDDAQRWWRGTSRMLRDSGVVITWEIFCEAFRQEYTPESYFSSREREFDNLKQGDMRVAEYARRFSALLVYMPHVANKERTKMNKFLKGLRLDLYRMVLSGSPATFMEALNNAVYIEESLMDPDAPVQQTTGRAPQPVQAASQSYQSPHGSQQPSRHQFRPRGKQFKKKGHSSSSGSVSSSSGSGSGSGSGGGFCGQCGGRHETSQCRGVRGLCHLCGQPGHFARACPSIGGRSSGQSQQGSAGGSSQRQQPFSQSQRSGFQPHEPSRFGGPSRPQFQIPQQAQANAFNREQAEETPSMVIGGTCFIYDYPARVLFDTGASHSFISELFVLAWVEFIPIV
ncbi:hypothetical protein F511_10401 [Dorcoceras hygrometricum]|uniref:CCHC-type domain-containing protein n=1 Tax=Dorcoceras hygrometricum TaxID=472368 RepID=A0A2Z7CBB0_9LAMI|nr:hypothetical protein F511_10401 [Dorcoceras hygrometricum]